MFPMAPEPWIDLSTGISPHSYPVLPLDSTALSRLPEHDRLEALKRAATGTYGAPAVVNVVASPGTQAMLPLIAGMVQPGKARILGPTYSEHLRCAALAGHDAAETENLNELENADLAIVVNPDNPTGRLLERGRLLSIAAKVEKRGGLLVVDEAFMDVVTPGQSVAGDMDAGNIVVLRSFGKFFGLAGVRLSFAVALQPMADHLSALLGPWPVSSPALEYGLAALADREWQSAMRERLAVDAARLCRLLASHGLEIDGGTDLFQLVRHRNAGGLFRHLGETGILVRQFGNRPQHLRFGLPGGAAEWERLETALENWVRSDSA